MVLKPGADGGDERLGIVPVVANVLPGDVREEFLVAVRFAVQDENYFLRLSNQPLTSSVLYGDEVRYQ